MIVDAAMVVSSLGVEEDIEVGSLEAVVGVSVGMYLTPTTCFWDPLVRVKISVALPMMISTPFFDASSAIALVNSPG